MIQLIHWGSKPKNRAENRAENKAKNRAENKGENRGVIQVDSGTCKGVRLSQRGPHLSDFGEKLKFYSPFGISKYSRF